VKIVARLVVYTSIGYAVHELVRAVQALLELDRVSTAEILAKIEPGSPTSYSVVQCEQWERDAIGCVQCGYGLGAPIHQKYREEHPDALDR
jgi:hypothetical protein